MTSDKWHIIKKSPNKNSSTIINRKKLLTFILSCDIIVSELKGFTFRFNNEGKTS